MYEFDSVSVSAFEAAELSGTLTEKSAEGWEVAGIVNAGSDVVAYLRRATGEADTDDTVEVISEVAPVEEAEVVGAEGTATTSDPTPSAAAASSASDLLASGASSGAQAESGGTGWGAGTSGDGSTSSGTSGSAWGGESSAGSWSGSAQQASAPPAQQQSTPSVPAGWYADPAGRFELRYWDGGAWTEHVSRAGQQYTDPPVA